MSDEMYLLRTERNGTMLAKALKTCTFNDFGDGGITYKAGESYEVEHFTPFDSSAFVVKHPEGGEIGFHYDFYNYFKIVNH